MPTNLPVCSYVMFLPCFVLSWVIATFVSNYRKKGNKNKPIMNYKDLIGKTVFDFCENASILAKVTGFSDPLESKDYITGWSYTVHAQMLQKLALEMKNQELYKAAKKYEDYCWKEANRLSNETGLIID